jgi:hypothetical protein
MLDMLLMIAVNAGTGIDSGQLAMVLGPIFGDYMMLKQDDEV